MPEFHIAHSTSYTFDDAVNDLELECCLMPRSDDSQSVHFHKIVSTPVADVRYRKQDAFGNEKMVFKFNRTLQKVDVSSVSRVTTLSTDWVRQGQSADNWASLFKPDELAVIQRHVEQFCGDLVCSKNESLPWVEQVCHKIYTDFIYDCGATDAQTPVSKVFELRRGVCQDLARVMIAVLNVNKIPARYVSGYLYSPQPDCGEFVQTTSHAWVLIKLPGGYWKGIDPTNNQWVDENYITVAAGRDYVDVIPMKGQVSQALQQKMKVMVNMKKRQTKDDQNCK